MTEIQIFYDGPIVKRKDAVEAGLRFYFTGKPCKHGHIDQRYSCVGGGCVRCISIRTKQWIADNEERYDAVSREYRRRPEVRAAQKERSARWHNENKEKANEMARQWQIDNPEKVAERNKKWRDANPEHGRAMSSRRRAKIRSAGGTYDHHDVRELLIMQEHRCKTCDKCLIENQYDIDHIVPLSRGGTNWPDNLQILCRYCNRSKGSKLPEDWNPPKPQSATEVTLREILDPPPFKTGDI